MIAACADTAPAWLWVFLAGFLTVAAAFFVVLAVSVWMDTK